MSNESNPHVAFNPNGALDGMLKEIFKIVETNYTRKDEMSQGIESLNNRMDSIEEVEPWRHYPNIVET